MVVDRVGLFMSENEQRSIAPLVEIAFAPLAGDGTKEGSPYPHRNRLARGNSSVMDNVLQGWQIPLATFWNCARGGKWEC